MNFIQNQQTQKSSELRQSKQDLKKTVFTSEFEFNRFGPFLFKNNKLDDEIQLKTFYILFFRKKSNEWIK